MSEIKFEFEFEPVEKCPLCISVRKQAYMRILVPPAGTASYVMCSSCGLVYLDPAPTPGSLGEFYSTVYLTAEYRKIDGASYPDPRDEILQAFRVMEENVDFLEQFKAPPGKLLDVGCSHGAFMLEAECRGWTAEGIEPFGAGARFCREKLRLNVKEGEFPAGGFEAESYDVITMWEVLEHLRDPVAAMKLAARITRPGGIILLTSPNAFSPAAMLLKERWIGWKPPTHLVFFDYGTMKRLLRRTGWAPLKMKSGGVYHGRILVVAEKMDRPGNAGELD